MTSRVAADTPRMPWRGLVRLATVVLPAGSVRDRYRQELVAEMYDMDHSAQRRHALSVAVGAWTLRSAVRGRIEAMETPMRKSIQCLLGRHRDEWMSNEDGGRFQRCTRCGRYRYETSWYYSTTPPYR